MLKKLFMVISIVVLALAGCDDSSSSGTSSGPTTLPLPVISTTELPRGERTTAYNFQLSASTTAGSGPVSWSLKSGSAALPTGLNLSTIGLLSGIPTVGGLFEMEFVALNAKGGSAEVALDLVVYEPIGYTHTPDIYDSPGNDDYTDATSLGALTVNSPIVQSAPLSVTSEPAATNPDPSDFLKFSTATAGEIVIEVFYSKPIGELYASIHGERKGVNELVLIGSAGNNGDDRLIILPNAQPGVWYLKIDAKLKNGVYHENAYSFRIRQRSLTITSSHVEHDTAGNAAVNTQLKAEMSGTALVGGIWSLEGGTLPTGVSLNINGFLTGPPTESGLFTITAKVQLGDDSAQRKLDVRIYDSANGDYWQRYGEHRFYDVARTDGDGVFHEHYCEATVVAPHPDYGTEGAVYVFGGRASETKDNVYVFHTDHQADNDKDYKLQDIGKPLTTQRQYLGAAFLQHTYGGYIYVVGGELYSNTTPSSGLFCRTVERLKVADGSGVALTTFGSWEAIADLPAVDAIGRQVEGFAEFGLVANDAAIDGDDRLYLVAGRIRVESGVGTASFSKELNSKVLMFEAPLGASATGTWFEKTDAIPYTPRRFPCVGLIDSRIYILGGSSAIATEAIVEMYQPDPVGTNTATATEGSSSFPALGQAIWYGASAVHNGELYVLNGWKPSFMSPADKRLQKFTPNGAGTGGTMTALTSPDVGSGFHSAVFHDGKMWFITGRDPFNPAPKFSLRYTP